MQIRTTYIGDGNKCVWLLCLSSHAAFVKFSHNYAVCDMGIQKIGCMIYVHNVLPGKHTYVCTYAALHVLHIPMYFKILAVYALIYDFNSDLSFIVLCNNYNYHNKISILNLHRRHHPLNYISPGILCQSKQHMIWSYNYILI